MNRAGGLCRLGPPPPLLAFKRLGIGVFRPPWTRAFSSDEEEEEKGGRRKQGRRRRRRRRRLPNTRNLGLSPPVCRLARRLGIGYFDVARIPQELRPILAPPLDEFDCMRLRYATMSKDGVKQVVAASFAKAGFEWKHEIAPSPWQHFVYPEPDLFWPNPILHNHRLKSFCLPELRVLPKRRPKRIRPEEEDRAVVTQSERDKMKLKVKQNAARLGELWNHSASSGVSWDDLDRLYTKYADAQKARLETWREMSSQILGFASLVAREQVIRYRKSYFTAKGFTVKTMRNKRELLLPRSFFRRRIRSLLARWRRQYIDKFSNGNLSECLKAHVTKRLIDRDIAERSFGLPMPRVPSATLERIERLESKGFARQQVDNFGHGVIFKNLRAWRRRVPRHVQAERLPHRLSRLLLKTPKFFRLWDFAKGPAPKVARRRKKMQQLENRRQAAKRHMAKDISDRDVEEPSVEREIVEVLN